MKIARASAADAENLLDLLHKTDTLLKKIETMRSRYALYPQDDCPEIFDVVDAASALTVMSFDGLTRAALNLMTLLDPKNEVIDPDCPHLQKHPKLGADTARLEWLAASGGEIRRLDNGRWCIKHYVPARPVMGIAETSGHTLRTVIDAAMRQSALPETQP